MTVTLPGYRESHTNTPKDKDRSLFSFYSIHHHHPFDIYSHFIILFSFLSFTHTKYYLTAATTSTLTRSRGISACQVPRVAGTDTHLDSMSFVGHIADSALDVFVNL
jgi:hypothetical protein